MTNVNIKEIDWVIIRNDYQIVVRASLGDISLGSKVYKYTTREEAKKMATEYIKKNGSLY